MSLHEHQFVRETPYGRDCRQRDAIQAIRDGYYREWFRIVSKMHADIERVKREGK